MQNRGGFTATEKTGNEIGFSHARSRTKEKTPIVSKNLSKEKKEEGATLSAAPYKAWIVKT
ncbi:hypothetical protein GCM10011513_36730 [Franconibacter daqui]|nr:hypothetical protein GCM10011513_36730 [Franconibacter daqui]